jgi:hypothetical protein
MITAPSSPAIQNTGIKTKLTAVGSVSSQPFGILVVPPV